MIDHKTEVQEILNKYYYEHHDKEVFESNLVELAKNAERRGREKLFSQVNLQLEAQISALGNDTSVASTHARIALTNLKMLLNRVGA